MGAAYLRIGIGLEKPRNYLGLLADVMFELKDPLELSAKE
jgi:hypothetical protein